MNFEKLHYAAHTAGLAAGRAATTAPMIVGTAASIVGNAIDYSQPTYVVPDGVCGFAWVSMKGNTSYARWARVNGIGRKGYPGGMQIPVREFGQSMQRKEAYAAAYANVLRATGIDCYADSRMD